MYMFKDRHGTFYLRIVLDKGQRQRTGKGEYRKSLRTKSIREARRKLPEAYMKALEVLSPKEHQESTASPRYPLSVFFKEYLKHLERIDVRPKTLEDKKIILNVLMYVIGNKDIASITRSDALAFKNTALELPPRVSVLINKGLSLKEIQKSTTKRVTVSTVNNWVRNLSAMFDYAQKEGYVSENNFKGLAISQKNIRASSLRDAFTPSEVNTIIDYISDNYTKKDSKYWIVLIGAYSGMRLGEITQLYKDNIIKHDGIWCFYVNADKEDQSIKNLSSERLVPIHQYLLDQGFLTFVDSKEGRLFDDLKFNKLLGYRGGVSKWFSKVVTDLGIKHDKGKSFHSFRHFLATECKQKHESEHVTASILGHSSPGNGITYGRYGKNYSVGYLKEVIDRVNSEQ